MARSDRSEDDRVKRARALYTEGVAGGALAAIGGSLAGSSIGWATAVIGAHFVKSAGNSL